MERPHRLFCPFPVSGRDRDAHQPRALTGCLPAGRFKSLEEIEVAFHEPCQLFLHGAEFQKTRYVPVHSDNEPIRQAVPFGQPEGASATVLLGELFDAPLDEQGVIPEHRARDVQRHRMCGFVVRKVHAGEAATDTLAQVFVDETNGVADEELFVLRAQ
jgi:hypothetical protein